MWCTGHIVGSGERPGGPSGSVPRRQRCARRRLSFGGTEAFGDEPEPSEPEEPHIERHTSGIYDLIDAISLLGAHSPFTTPEAEPHTAAAAP